MIPQTLLKGRKWIGIKRQHRLHQQNKRGNRFPVRKIFSIWKWEIWVYVYAVMDKWGVYWEFDEEALDIFLKVFTMDVVVSAKTSNELKFEKKELFCLRYSDSRTMKEVDLTKRNHFPSYNYLPTEFQSFSKSKSFTTIPPEILYRNFVRRGVTDIIENKIALIPDVGWIGYSHRASFLFKPGQKVDFDSAGFVARDRHQYLQWLYYRRTGVRFTIDQLEKFSERDIWQKDKSGDCMFLYKWTDGYNGENSPTQGPGYDAEYFYIDGEYKGTRHRNFYPELEKWGNGEWTAKTMEDAKQMAINFADDVA